MPLKWLDMTKLEEILVKVETLVHSAKTKFRKYRGSYINETVSAVVNEQFETRDACVSDYVDTAIANKGIVCTCSKCGNTYQKTLVCLIFIQVNFKITFSFAIFVEKRSIKR